MNRSARTDGSRARRSVYELTDAVRERIIRGELEPGERLTEEWIASEFGVSRIPMREALRALAAEGFVRAEGYGGTFVAELDAEAAHDLLDVRAALEPLAAAQAALRCTPKNLETLRSLLADAKQARREGRYEDQRTLKGRFSEHLAVASENRTLIALMRVVRFKIEWATSIEAIKTSPQEKRAPREKILREIIDAIAQGDPSRAAAAAAANIEAAYASQGWRPAVDLQSMATSERGAG